MAGPNFVQTVWRLGTAWARTNLLGGRIPLLVSWNLTFRCNLRCHYCAAPTLRVPQMDTEEILRIADDFYELGMRWVTFSGGEPLLRKDIGAIVNHCKDKGVVVFISTNGTLVPRRIDDIRRVDRITLSLDGAGEVHDRIRGEGAWEKTIAAAETAREHGIPVAFTCVLSEHNLECVDDVLEVARQQHAHVMFQPATKWLDSSTKPNPIAPDTGPYRAAIDRLIQRKREGAPITNSMTGLKRLRNWPDPTPVRSTAGRVTCTIEPDGKVLASHLTMTGCLEDEADDGLTPAERFKKMALPKRVDQPWCGPILELDLIFGLNPDAILNALRVQD